MSSESTIVDQEEVSRGNLDPGWFSSTGDYEGFEDSVPEDSGRSRSPVPEVESGCQKPASRVLSRKVGHRQIAADRKSLFQLVRSEACLLDNSCADCCRDSRPVVSPSHR